MKRRREEKNMDDQHPASLPSERNTKNLIMDKTDGGPVKYPMRRKGPVYIINNYNGCTRFPFRSGSGYDAGNLITCFKKLGFSCEESEHVFANLNSTEMVYKCREWAAADHANHDCIVVAILTHGETPDKLRGADGINVPLECLLREFLKTNTTLIGKPKIFIIQACRGDKDNIGIKDYTPKEAVSFSPPQESGNNASQFSTPFIGHNSGYLPRQADRLIAFATGIGHQAYRNTESGSWYIMGLTNALEKEYVNPKSTPRHFVDVLTEVQGSVSNYVHVDHVKQENLVQMPEFQSTLRGPIYF